MNQALLGVDIGTGGCKCTAINSAGQILAVSFCEYPSDHAHPGWSEQNPVHWDRAFIQTVRAVLSSGKVSGEDIAAIAFSASTHNAVLLDKEGNVIRPCIMWNDQRSAAQAQQLKARHGKIIFETTMQVPTATWTMPQLLWVKENDPESFSKIHRILFTKDYVRHSVTGDWYTDHVDASGSLFYDPRNARWSKKMCDLIGLPVEVLPEVLPSRAIAGKVRGNIAALTGLHEGTPVITGCSDTAAEDFGAGGVNEGQIIVKLATAGNCNLITSKGRSHEKAFTYPHAVQGMWYMATGTNSSASSFRWLRDALYMTEKQIFEKDGKNVYTLMDEHAAQVPVGARGLIFHPYILGERCPYFNAKARADFFGVSMVHDKRYFARAVLEGVAYSLYDCFQVLCEFAESMSEIRLIGGGAKSPLWCQIVSDVFGLPVKRPENDDSSFGGALLAGVGIGVFENERAAVNKANKIVRIYEPDMANHRKYESFFSIYQQIVKASEPLWEQLYDLAND